MSENAILLEQLSAGYGRRRVLEGFDLTVSRGSVTGLLGFNGAGKTTLMRVLNGLLPAAAGKARVLGLDPWQARVALQQRLAFVPEHPVLYEDMTALEFFAFCRRLHPRWDEAFAREKLEFLAVPAAVRLAKLSRGQRGLVSLTAALARRGEVLLLDDPTLGLDVRARRDFYRMILEDLVEREAAILFATHQPAEVEGVLTHAAFLRDGRIIVHGALDELKRDRAVNGESLDLEELTLAILGGNHAA